MGVLCGCDVYCVLCKAVITHVPIVAPGFTAGAIAGNVTTTSLVVGNAVGTPNTIGGAMLGVPTLGATTGSLTITGGIPTTTVGVPIMKVGNITHAYVSVLWL